MTEDSETSSVSSDNVEKTSAEPKRHWPLPWAWGLLVFLYIADQVTKLIVVENFFIGQSQPVIPGFLNWTFVTNTGVAFGMLQGNNILLGIVVTLLISVGLWIAREFDWKQTEVNIIGAMILSGAIGNLTDRVVHGHVIDFVDVYFDFGLLGVTWLDWGVQHWPAFNIADSCITCSVCWIIFRTLTTFESEDKEAGKAN